MFNSYDELMEAVSERQTDTLTLEVDLGSGEYSPEYEQAKKQLQQVRAMESLAANQPFLGGTSGTEALEQKVKELAPEPKLVWLKFGRIPLRDWALLVKQKNVPPIDQYEKVLKSTFIGIFGEPDATEPLATDSKLVGTTNDSILNGGTLLAVISSFMDWQNAGGTVTINPTKSAHDSDSY